jgi:hypothetical protein
MVDARSAQCRCTSTSNMTRIKLSPKGGVVDNEPSPFECPEQKRIFAFQSFIIMPTAFQRLNIKPANPKLFSCITHGGRFCGHEKDYLIFFHPVKQKRAAVTGDPFSNFFLIITQTHRKSTVFVSNPEPCYSQKHFQTYYRTTILGCLQ